MRVYLLVFAAALSVFSHATQFSSDRAYNPSNVFNGSLHAPQRRRNAQLKPAADDVWNRYVQKGSKLIAQMSYSDFDAAKMFDKPKTTAQSPYGYDSLTMWGYKMFQPREFRFCDFGAWGIGWYLRRISISDNCEMLEGTWKAAAITHGDLEGATPIKNQVYIGPDGKTRRATGAAFHMAVTPEGAIMTQVRKSPWESIRETHSDASEAELPNLQRSSDMMWAMWEHLIPKSHLHQVNLFITVAIENPTTLSLIRRALDRIGEELSENGVKIDMNTDEGKALLSSPNGAGFAHFLIERKAQVGLKSIDSVWLMECTDLASSPCMSFHVRNLRAPTPPKH